MIGALRISPSHSTSRSQNHHASPRAARRSASRTSSTCAVRLRRHQRRLQQDLGAAVRLPAGQPEQPRHARLPLEPAAAEVLVVLGGHPHQRVGDLAHLGLVGADRRHGSPPRRPAARTARRRRAAPGSRPSRASAASRARRRRSASPARAPTAPAGRAGRTGSRTSTRARSARRSRAAPGPSPPRPGPSSRAAAARSPPSTRAPAGRRCLRIRLQLTMRYGSTGSSATSGAMSAAASAIARRGMNEPSSSRLPRRSVTMITPCSSSDGMSARHRRAAEHADAVDARLDHRRVREPLRPHGRADPVGADQHVALGGRCRRRAAGPRRRPPRRSPRPARPSCTASRAGRAGSGAACGGGRRCAGAGPSLGGPRCGCELSSFSRLSSTIDSRRSGVARDVSR